jgi:hypothetical protein
VQLISGEIRGEIGFSYIIGNCGQTMLPKPSGDLHDGFYTNRIRM